MYGRSGDLIIDSESYDNISVTYKVATIPGLYGDRFIDEVMTELKAWLLRSVAYQKLYDTDLPDGFYYAFCSNISDAVWTFDDMYEFSITFSCKPFFYFDAGQDIIETTERTITLNNFGTQTTFPLIILFGSGTLTCHVNGKYFTVNDVSSAVSVDCETMKVLSGITDKYEDFSGVFPSLSVGSNTFSFSGDGFTKARIIPRWCRL